MFDSPSTPISLPKQLTFFFLSSTASVNFLQIVSLAGGLPLQWPSAMQTMFDFFATLSSAGTTLMIPGRFFIICS